jgi:hypothetical protein
LSGRGKNHGHGASFQQGHPLHGAVSVQPAGNGVQHLPTDLRMRVLASAKRDRDLDLVSLSQEVLDGPHSIVHIMLGDSRLEPHFLDRLYLLGLARLALLAGLLVLEPSVVQDFADGRRGCGTNLDEIEVVVPSYIQGLRKRNDSKLFAVLANQPDLASPDLVVDAELFGDRLTS